MPILQDSMQAQTQAPASTGQSLPPPNPAITNQVVAGYMDEVDAMRAAMPAEIGDAFDRVLVAGKKLLYSQQTQEVVQGIITDDSIPVENKLGEGVANLVVMMDNQGNGTIPKEVMIPVGVALMFEAADYLSEMGVEITDEILSKALEFLLYGVFAAYGIEQDQVDQVIDKMGADLGFSETPEAGEPVEADAGSGPLENAPPMNSGDAEFEAAFNKQRGQ